MMPAALRALVVGLLLFCATIYLLPVAADPGISEPGAPKPPISSKLSIETSKAEPAVPTVYGIGLSGLCIEHARVRRGETLAEILGRCDVPYGRILEVARACDGVFNLRQMRAGNPYCLLRGDDGALHYFIYEPSLQDYVVFDLTGDPSVRSHRKPSQVRLRTVSATVAASLWEALQDQDVGAELIVQLDDVFGQVVDLFYLQPGDDIRMVFEEIYIDGRRAAYGRIRAARLVHNGQPFNAFYHETEARRGYFDETGRSLQRAFLKAPLKYNRISSGFSNHRFHPILKIYRKHHAIDYAAPLGTPVLAVGDGTVLRTGVDKDAGRYIRLRHGSRYESRYIHLSRFASGVKHGRRVQRGEVIGYVGQTGLATGPHLDFAFYRDGVAVNFRKIDSPPAEPVAADQMARFEALVAHYRSYLDGDQPTVVASPTIGLDTATAGGA